MERTNRQATKYRDSLNRAIDESNISGIFEAILTIWVGEWASDVYFEPFEDYWVVGMTVWWAPNDLGRYPISLHNPIISKIMNESGQMNSDENDSQKEVKVAALTANNKEVILFIRTFITAWWEELLMRIEEPQKKDIQNSQV